MDRGITCRRSHHVSFFLCLINEWVNDWDIEGPTNYDDLSC